MPRLPPRGPVPVWLGSPPFPRLGVSTTDPVFLHWAWDEDLRNVPVQVHHPDLRPLPGECPEPAPEGCDHRESWGRGVYMDAKKRKARKLPQ